MKLEDLTYKVVMRSFELLEQQYHYKVNEETRKEVARTIHEELMQLIEK